MATSDGRAERLATKHAVAEAFGCFQTLKSTTGCEGLVSALTLLHVLRADRFERGKPGFAQREAERAEAALNAAMEAAAPQVMGSHTRGEL